jgi:hypothetical protein
MSGLQKSALFIEDLMGSSLRRRDRDVKPDPAIAALVIEPLPINNAFPSARHGDTCCKIAFSYQTTDDLIDSETIRDA